MPRKPKYTKKEIADALDQADGSRIGASDALGCDVRTVFNYLDRYPELKQIADAGTERVTDEARTGLIELIRERHPSAIFFWLKTRAGWSERQEVQHSGETTQHVHVHQPPPRPATREEWMKSRQQIVQEALADE